MLQIRDLWLSVPPSQMVWIYRTAFMQQLYRIVHNTASQGQLIEYRSVSHEMQETRVGRRSVSFKNV